MTMSLRVLFVGDELYLIVARENGNLVAERLSGRRRESATKMLDDVHAEIAAHLLGFEAT
ncbi:MAG: hypothetical protein JJ863_17615 [Deltaproteobacteria bacterium]|nr:hypothetical protein [Deltaproteobacteria bacterium]